MFRPIRRIVVASGLAVALIAAALVLTVWSYRDAVSSRSAMLESANERAASQAAEKDLAYEREAMNEYLISPSQRILAEITARQGSFDASMSFVGTGDADEAPFVESAVAANDEFLKLFARRGARNVSGIEAFRRLESGLNAGERAVLVPLHALRLVNQRQATRVELRADVSSSRALVAAVLAAAVAIASGLGFALYAIRLVREIGSRNEQLRELDRLKDDFVASVSHELRTPLTSIRGYLELVLDGEAGEINDEQRHFLSVVERNADRLLRVVGDLLFVAQVDAGKIALEPGPTDLEELARHAVEAARPAATEKNIELELELELDELGELQADRARIAQVLDNLISNAVKFTPAGGRVAVRTLRSGDMAVLEVADTGMGISTPDQEQLFERFFRADSATEHAIQGTGLGLAIVKAIVEAHDGAISVVSIQGEGATFRIELPLEREQVAA
jgi:signal transduction histidine kinase